MATKPHISVDSAVKLLTSTMQDPMKANVCAVRLAVAADSINLALEACPSAAEKIKIAKSYPELLRAGIKFLTFSQSPPDHVAMVNRFITCRCDFGQSGMRLLHKPSRYRADGQIKVDLSTLLFDAVTTVSNCLILALAERTQHKFHTGNANTGERRWPQGPEDLLPHGPKDSVIGLELWVALAPLGYTIFKLAGHLALFHVPFAREIFQSEPKFHFALARPFQHLEAAVKFYEEGHSSPAARTHFFDHPVMTIFEFFENLVHCETVQFNMMITARGKWMSTVLPRLTTILSTLPLEWSDIRGLVMYLTAHSKAEIDPVTGYFQVKFERKLMTELPYFDGLKHAFNKMVDARKMGCWNIACPSASEAVQSRLCSKCTLIRFCGEKCQKEAWKSTTLPHKPICAKIHSLKESLGADNWALLWTPDFTYAQFQTMCRAKTVDVEVVEAIGSTISALKLRKIALRVDEERAGESQIDRLKRAEREKVARQKQQDLIESLGRESVTVLGREDTLSMMSSGAYS